MSGSVLISLWSSKERIKARHEGIMPVLEMRSYRKSSFRTTAAVNAAQKF